MAFQEVPLVAELALHFLYTGSDREYLVTSSWLRLGGWDAGLVQDLAEVARSGVNAHLKAYVPDTAELSSVTTRDLSEEFGVQGLDTTVVAGTNAATDWLPPNCAVGILLRCGESGPPRFGYAFWPFVEEGDCDRVGTLSGQALDVPGAYKTWSDYVESTMTGIAHVVVSRYYTPVPGEGSVLRAEGIPGAVTSTAIGRGGFVASQRDRRAGP